MGNRCTVLRRGAWAGLIVLLAALLAIAVSWSTVRAELRVSDGMLTAAWSEQPPYQYLGRQDSIAYPAGLDIVLLQEIADHAGVGVEFRFTDFGESLDSLKDGSIDILSGAYDTEARRDHAISSRPYRTGRDRLFLSGTSLPEGGTPEQVIERAVAEGITMAMVGEYHWQGSLGDALDAAREAGMIVDTGTLLETVDAVRDGRADGFVADQLTGMTVAAALGLPIDHIHPVVLQERDIHFLYSRESVPEALIDRLEASLLTLQNDGTLDGLIRQFTGPLAISLALDGQWFNGLIAIGIIAFSVSGVVIARTGGYSIYGALVLASLPALGGGVVRDLLLLREVYLFSTPNLLLACLATIALGYMINRGMDLVRGRALWFFDLINIMLHLRRRISPHLVMQVFDALGLAAFTVVAVSVAAEEGIEPLWLWGPILAAVTATGGAILRDMIRKDAVNPVLHTVFYGEAALIWAFGLSLYLQVADAGTRPQQVFLAIALTMAGVFATRMAFVIFRLRSPPY